MISAAADPAPDPPADWAVQTEQGVVDAMVALAPSLGWGAALPRALRERGLSPADGALLLPGGARDAAALLSRRHDARAMASLDGVDPNTLRIRERITRGIDARLEAAAQDGETARRCLGFLALPPNLALGLRLAWESADALWRWAGDTATDENHYSKRAILSGVLIAALPLRLSAGQEAAQRFVQARVNGIMRFETWKAGLPQDDLPARIAEALGRLRYGARAGR